MDKNILSIYLISKHLMQLFRKGEKVMEKTSSKKYILRISLILILIVSAFLSIFAVQNYSSNSSITQSSQLIREKNIPQSGGGAPSEIRKFVDSDKNSQVNPNGDSQGNQSNVNDNKPKGSNRNMRPGELIGNMQRGDGNSKYLQQLTVYSVVFLILSCGIYYILRRKEIIVDFHDEKYILITMLAVGFLLRISASTLMNGHNDINLFKNWAQVAANGFSQFYSNARQADYPPFYMYVLALIGKLASLPILNAYYILLLKIPSMAADVITGYFIYKLGKKYLSSSISILLAFFYIFNPAVFIDSTFWGQVDSFFTLLIVFAIYFLCEKRYVFSSLMFAISVLMKPQGLIFLPILFFELVRQRKLKNFIYCAVSFIVAAIIIIIPFTFSQESSFWIVNLYSKTISEYPYASVNAFNFFSFIGANFKNNNLTLFLFSYHTIGMSFIIITTLISWFIYIKGNSRKYISAIGLLQIAGVFTFSVGMHERYLFPAVALAIVAFIYLRDKKFFSLAIGFSITSYINIAVVLFGTTASTFNIFLRGTSFLNILLVIYLVKILLENALKKVSNNLSTDGREVL